MLEDIRDELIRTLFEATYDIKALDIKGIMSQDDDQDYTISTTRGEMSIELLQKYFKEVDIEKVIEAAETQARENVKK